MLNFPPMTAADRKALAKIQHRRQFEEERKARIFNPRLRVLGIDQETLKYQIEEKQKQRGDERNDDETFVKDMLERDRLAVALEQKEKEEKRRIQKEIDDFRKHQQKREFGPNNELLEIGKVKVPNPEECGPSAAQSFQGEDHIQVERSRIQKEQSKAWLEQQMLEKRAALVDQKETEAAFLADDELKRRQGQQLNDLEAECRKQLRDACTRFNKALAEQKKEERIQLRHEDEQDNRAEIHNCMTSDLLLENPDVSISNLGPSRRIGYLYKGMTEDEKQDIRKYQLSQINEAQSRRELEKRQQQEFEHFAASNQNIIHCKDEELKTKMRQIHKEIEIENLRLADEQRRYRQFLNDVVYRNKATDEFYEQFNKSTR